MFRLPIYLLLTAFLTTACGPSQSALDAAKKEATDQREALEKAQARIKSLEAEKTARIKQVDELNAQLAGAEAKVKTLKKAIADTHAKAAGATKTSVGTKPGGSSGGPQVATSPGVTDPEIVKALKTVLEHCNVRKDSGWASDCKHKELTSLTALLKTKGLKTSLETLSVLVTSSDAPLKHLAAYQLSSNYAAAYPPPRAYKALKKDPSIVTGDLALRLIHAMKKHKSATVGHIAPMATHAATMTNHVPTLFFILEKHDDNYVKRTAIQNLLVMTRLKYFPKLKELVKWGDARILESALKAATNLPDPQPAEKAVLCPWGQTRLSHTENEVAAEAGKLMNRCGGIYIDALLNEVEARLKRNNFAVPSSLTRAVGAICSGWRTKAGTAAQCKRTQGLLKAIAESNTIDWTVRADAIRNIYYGFKNAETLALLRTYETSPIPHIKWAAKEQIRSLVKYHKLKDGKPVDRAKTPTLHTWYTSTYRMKKGQTVTVHCPPNGKLNSVTGSGPYSGDTSICSAAVHAGKATVKGGGVVTIKVAAGIKGYKSSVANGVKSNKSSYPTQSSYTFQ